MNINVHADKKRTCPIFNYCNYWSNTKITLEYEKIHKGNLVQQIIVFRIFLEKFEQREEKIPQSGVYHNPAVNSKNQNNKNETKKRKNSTQSTSHVILNCDPLCSVEPSNG